MDISRGTMGIIPGLYVTVADNAANKYLIPDTVREFIPLSGIKITTILLSIPSLYLLSVFYFTTQDMSVKNYYFRE